MLDIFGIKVVSVSEHVMAETFRENWLLYFFVSRFGYVFIMDMRVNAVFNE